ncbi:RidA family protein [Georgenia yuyongxinii]|uniref:RidA family protein n=1 Tax=Georgenia yuyongxinii TaxID=2589797 RepID=A0A552WXL2_9MICO|nr:RidA family protein [Georgenia yuyongxinii]TRW47570.1 RidA family protein [Georgenia yuyongxinii]
MTQIEHIDPATMGPAQGLYTQLIHVRSGGLVFVSGQVAIGPDGSFVGEGDVERQTRQILENIGAALAHVGQGWEALVKLTTYLTSASDYPAFAAARKDFFDTHYPEGRYPTHTLLVVDALSAPHHLVELEAVIAVPEAAR